jgi:electron transfer flavoprotein alpha subunit
MTKKTNDVWVFIEQRSGKVAEVSYELLSKGHKLAQNISGKLKAVLIGYQLQEMARSTFQYGVDEVYVIDHSELTDYRTMPYSHIMNELVSTHKPRVVLFGATVIGRDLAPRIASFTRSGLTADCTDLRIESIQYLRKDYKDLLLQIRPAFGGNIIATIITPDAPIQMATVREGVMENIPLPSYRQGRITKLPYQAAGMDQLLKVVERFQEENKVNLKAAPIVVAGGYGMGSKANFKLIHELAHVLGGEVAGSRAAVDAGFIPHERQVGQTGVTVRPKLYIACGISGAIQHRAGMQESNKIVAINTDADAPIFDICHYGIVGDACEVIPKFIEAYRHKLK